MRLITPGQFRCNCGKPKCGAPRPSLLLLFKINRAVLRAGVSDAVYIRSGCRCANTNKRLGGCPGSAHRFGLAADIGTSNLTTYQLSRLFDAVDREQFAARGYGFGFIHVDIRKINAEGDHDV